MSNNPNINNDTNVSSNTNINNDINMSSNPNKKCKINLKTEFPNLNCSNENYYSKDCNQFLLKKELLEQACISTDENAGTFLYPNLNDKEFNIKIATKKEFDDTKYDGVIHNDIKEYADKLSKMDFELQPHQQFVKNFLSSQTPYNSLLLFHGLGTGKTCSAIGVCEEMRDYMKQSGLTKKMIIVASENVQDNFRLQLFDERKLQLVNGVWNIKSCIGNKLLKEVNPTSIKGITKERLSAQIKNLINSYYLFVGYGQFANYIIKTMNTEDGTNLTKQVVNKIRNEFDERLIVIDEIHNIRITDDNENKKVAIYLDVLVKTAANMRLVLLSATPMYNNYKEIVWLLNIMNMNDRRGKIDVSSIFDKNGNFKENGEELLIRKATGYVSFIRGENPYTFPYRVYPNEFAVKHTFPYIKYPTYQMNMKKIPDDSRKRILYLYLNEIDKCDKCGECQYCIYKYIIHYLRTKENMIVTKRGQEIAMPSFQNMDKFGYTVLQNPLRSLIISYPYEGANEVITNVKDEEYEETFSQDTNTETNDTGANNSEANDMDANDIVNTIITSKTDNLQKGGIGLDPNELTGKKGLERMMNFVDTNSPPEKGKFAYKSATLSKYGKIFSRDKIGKYSAKIKCILNSILNPTTQAVSDGVILIYSQYLDGGLIPVALALEEMGFIRYGNNAKSLFLTKPTETVDARTLKPASPTGKKEDFLPARYSIITGDKRLSPDNEFEVKGLTNENNKDGNRVKVVLISRAGAEGIDFKFIRQIHILDPWYNMSRIEQILGRGVRNFSHKDLDFEKRNVEIYMHGTILGKENKEEAADLYVFRFAELKAIQIGKITRLLKETAVDCIVNHDQTNFTQEKIMQMIDTPITQKLSTGMVLHNFKIGDAPFSPACDYMANCDYACRPNKVITEGDITQDTFNEKFIFMNNEKIKQKMKMLMKESYFYKKDVLLSAVNGQKKYPLVQIYACLSQLIDDETEIITDKYGRSGRLINIDDYYLFQPLELNNKQLTNFERATPIDYKSEHIEFEIRGREKEKEKEKENERARESERAFKEYELSKERKEPELVKQLNANYELAKEYEQIGKVPRGENNWYKHAGTIIKKLTLDYHEMTNDLLRFLVAHIIEELFFREKWELMNYLYSLDNIEKNTFIWYLKSYFDNKIITTQKFTFYIMYDLATMKIMILNENNRWTVAEPEDQREIAMQPESKKALAFNIDNYNKYVGFLGYKRKNAALVFKTKDMQSTRDTGALCEESGKEKSIQKLNLILEEEKYTAANTKMIKDKKGNVLQEAVTQVEVCVMQEFFLRYFNTTKKNGKKWFLTPEMAIYYKLYKIL